MPSFRAFFLPLLFATLVFIPAMGNAGQTADGLHTEAWFNQSSGDLSRDLESANQQGKILAIFWEQPGCHFCEKMHDVNLKVEETAQFIQQNFYAVLLNMRGNHDIKDFDGNVMSVAKLARVHKVAGTPTIEFRNAEAEEVSRLPGYARPVVFHGVFDYVASKAYEEQALIPWLKANYLGKQNAGG